MVSFKNRRFSARTLIGVAAGGAAAAATALWVRKRAREAERDNPPVGRFIEADGVRLHYIDKGTGPALVLLHGNTVLLQDFEGSGLIDRLARHHRVLAFDRPGFGHSERPRGRRWNPQAQAALIRRALLQLGVEDPVVLGHSWGTLVALALAMDFPPVRGLVLISGYYYPTARLDVALVAPAALPVIGDALRYTVSPLAARLTYKRAVAAMFDPAPIPDGFFQVVPAEMILRPVQLRADAEDAAFMVPAAAHYRARYAGLAVPVALFAGREDKVVDPQAHSGRLHRELPDSELTMAPTAGHMAHYLMADEICDAVARLAGGFRREEASAGCDQYPQ